MTRERKGERLSLTELLAKPHQRIPRYKMLIQVWIREPRVLISFNILVLVCRVVFLQRLLKNTEPDHSDFPLLRAAVKEMHELAMRFDAIQKETIEHENRQKVLHPPRTLLLSLCMPTSLHSTPPCAIGASPVGAVYPRPEPERPVLPHALPSPTRPGDHDQRAVDAKGQVPLPL